MKYLRTLAALLGVLLIVGELARSWGQGRNILFVVDDFFIGIPLLLMAMLMSKPSTVRFCGLTAAFAAVAAGLYGSFFGKIVDLEQEMASNFENEILTALIGLAFASSLAGVVASLYYASKWSK